MHDGAPVHFHGGEGAVLNETYLKEWIGRAEPVAWPPQSPDINSSNS